ncbi:hypothetical protein KCMC57_up39610 [Kitasatospora sp. CMC57]|uniref:Uncharacterized protein n=1 Tax=Kitasatospora sp. CMC57 TaxID=3231513 RepID=A0AB33JWH8_9ACTN
MYVTTDHALDATVSTATHDSAPAEDSTALLRELRDRTEILDALLRFGLGQDSGTRPCSPPPSPPTLSSTSVLPPPSGVANRR